jgi:hypothetical protein
MTILPPLTFHFPIHDTTPHSFFLPLFILWTPGRSYILKIKGIFVGLAEYQDDERRL